MTPEEASKIIGISPQQVRTLIRGGKIQAEKTLIGKRPVYNVSRKEALRYRKTPQTRGRPRGYTPLTKGQK